MKKISPWFLVFLGIALFLPSFIWAQSLPSVSVNIGGATNPKEISTTLQILLLVTVLALAPSIIVTMTSFSRFLIVFSLLRHAMGTNAVPPNQILVGLSFFMTLVVMGPTFKAINDQAIQPYSKNQLTQDEAFKAATKPLQDFMLKYTREKDLALFVSMMSKEKPKTREEISLVHIIPAFVISELKTSFQIGFMIYLPFLIIDIVVASVLLAMGMLVLPPVIISLPFKLMLFVLVDGWNLIVGSLVKSFEVTS